MIVWLASYPRSGNTFLRVLLKSVFELPTYSVYDDKFDIGADSKTSEIVGHLNLPADFDFEEARTSADLFVIKTHNAICEARDKAVYLLRDGRECTTSYLKYLRAYVGEGVCATDVVIGNVPFGRWGNHLTSWDPITRPNTLLLRFEDLVSRPESHLGAISEFLELDVKSERIPSFSELRKINPKFFRSGKFDSWKEHLTNDEVTLFWLFNRCEMQKYYPAVGLPDALARIDDLDTLDYLFNLIASHMAEHYQSDRLADQEGQIRLFHEIQRTKPILDAVAELCSLKLLSSPASKISAYRKLRDAWEMSVRESSSE